MSPFFYLSKHSSTPLIPGGATPILIVFTGESNSGGIALNTDASVGELALNSNVQILNNINLVFEPLEIGVNNLIGHLGLEAHWYLKHGWELELSQLVNANYFNQQPIYLVKAGAGGSQISEWEIGNTYYTNFLARLAAAKSAIFAQHNKQPYTAIYYSHGINDQIALTPVGTWKAATKAHFNKMVAAIGLPTKICMTYFQNPLPFVDYNDAIAEMTEEMPNVYAVESDGLDFDGFAHWTYTGMRTISNRMSFVHFLNHNKISGIGKIICDGNSLTAGGYGGLSYPELLSRRFVSVKNAIPVVNIGVGGQQTSQMATDAPMQIDSQWVADKINVLIAWEIGNDIYYNNDVPAACIRFKNYCLARKAAALASGIELKIISLTCIPRINVSDILLEEANEWQRDNWQSYSDALCDLRSDSRLVSIDGTYYNVDNVHLLQNGNEIIVEQILNELLKII